MHIRQNFRQFIGSGYWGKQKDFHNPSDEQLASNTFQVPVADTLQGAMSRSHLDYLNIGHNAQGFESLDAETRNFAQEVAERGGTYKEIIEHNDSGQKAAIHMSNVVDAQRSLMGTLLGPAGPALMGFLDSLSENVPAAENKQVSFRISQGGKDMVLGDLYEVTPHKYMDSELPGISGEPFARVALDLKEGAAYLFPDKVFRGEN